jgi:hypothetical protein
VGGIVVVNDEVFVADRLREIACNSPDRLVSSNGLLWVSSWKCIRALDKFGWFEKSSVTKDLCVLNQEPI